MAMGSQAAVRGQQQRVLSTFARPGCWDRIQRRPSAAAVSASLSRRGLTATRRQLERHELHRWARMPLLGSTAPPLPTHPSACLSHVYLVAPS